MAAAAATRILIAEDETIIRLDLRSLLESERLRGLRRGARRRRRRSSSRARSSRTSILMDIKMPRLDGSRPPRRILAERPMPIVMLTAFDQEELVARAVETGVFGYLVKPFREQDLIPAIRTAQARHAELPR